MNAKTVKIVDRARNLLAIAKVTECEGQFTGWIDLGPMPPELRHQFEEYEEIVNGQMFSLIDEIEEKIDALLLVALFDGGYETEVADLQIYPSTGRLSFKSVREPAHSPL